VSFKLGPEDCYRTNGRCGSDKIWQTVPESRQVQRRPGKLGHRHEYVIRVTSLFVRLFSNWGIRYSNFI